MLNDMPSC